jgi:hypothetical protein
MTTDRALLPTEAPTRRWIPYNKKVQCNQHGDYRLDIRQTYHNNSMASVRERTIPTERPPPVSEGSSANCYHSYTKYRLFYTRSENLLSVKWKCLHYNVLRIACRLFYVSTSSHFIILSLLSRQIYLIRCLHDRCCTCQNNSIDIDQAIRCFGIDRLSFLYDVQWDDKGNGLTGLNLSVSQISIRMIQRRLLRVPSPPPLYAPWSRQQRQIYDLEMFGDALTMSI